MNRDNYFFAVNVFLLLVVLIGFSPSFFLRSLSDAKPLPIYMIIHGIACTAWFIAIVLQSYWIKIGKTPRHRSYGTYFSLIVPLIVITGYAVILYAMGNYHSKFPPLLNGSEIEGERSFTALILVGDAIQLIIVSLFVYVGYRYRNKVATHKRSMLIASVLISQQAFVRLGKFDFLMIGDNPGASGGIYATLVPFLILISLVVYDLVEFKKVERVSIIGVTSYILFVASAMMLNVTGWGVQLLEALR